MTVTITKENALLIAKILGVTPSFEKHITLTPLEVQRLWNIAKEYKNENIKIHSTHSGIGSNTYVSIPRISLKIEITDYDSW